MMGSCCENFMLAISVCKICLYKMLCSCCNETSAPRPEYSAICVGLNDAGKTTLLSFVCNEDAANVQPTSGFIIKPIQLKDIILNVREIGGGVQVRQFWKHYFNDCQAIIFVVNSAASDDELNTAKGALENVLQNPQLASLPCLVLGNRQDVAQARHTEQLKESLELDRLCAGRQWTLYLCSREQPESAREGMEWISHQLRPVGVDGATCEHHHLNQTANDTTQFNAI